MNDTECVVIRTSVPCLALGLPRDVRGCIPAHMVTTCRGARCGRAGPGGSSIKTAIMRALHQKCQPRHLRGLAMHGTAGASKPLLGQGASQPIRAAATEEVGPLRCIGLARKEPGRTACGRYRVVRGKRRPRRHTDGEPCACRRCGRPGLCAPTTRRRRLTKPGMRWHGVIHPDICGSGIQWGLQSRGVTGASEAKIVPIAFAMPSQVLILDERPTHWVGYGQPSLSAQSLRCDQ